MHEPLRSDSAGDENGAGERTAGRITPKWTPAELRARTRTHMVFAIVAIGCGVVLWCIISPFIAAMAYFCAGVALVSALSLYHDRRCPACGKDFFSPEFKQYTEETCIWSFTWPAQLRRTVRSMMCRHCGVRLDPAGNVIAAADLSDSKGAGELK